MGGITMTIEEIKLATFDETRKGYNKEDVDDFVQKVAGQMEQLISEKEDAENKMYVLAQKIEEYRTLEETLKTALINAQRMGETVVREAKQKADAMMRDAENKADMLRSNAQSDVESEYGVLQSLRDEVSEFKATILTLYKQHIEALSGLDAPISHVDKYVKENPLEESAPSEETSSATAAFSESFEENYEAMPQNFTPLVDSSGEEELPVINSENLDYKMGEVVYPEGTPPSASLFDGYPLNTNN